MADYVTQEQFADQMNQPYGAPIDGAITDTRDYGPTPSGGSQGQAQPETPALTAGQAPPAAAAPPATTPAATGGSAAPAPGPDFSLRSYAARPGPYADLFKPLTGALGTGYEALGGEAGQFTEAAGPHRTFESAGGPGIFEQVYKPEAGQQDIEAAKGLIGARYQGPADLAGMDQATLEAINAAYEQLQAGGNALTGVAGVSNLVRQKTPGLTPGELTFEAKGLLSDPLFQEAARATQEDIGGFGGQLQGVETTAAGLGAARKGEEESIASQARAIPEARKGQVSSELEAAVAKQKADDEALQALYDQFQKTGSIQDLIALPGQEGETLKKSKVFRQGEKSNRVMARIDKNYQDLIDAGVPFLEPQVTSHGKQVLGFPADWYKKNQGKYTSAEMTALRNRALERNAQYEAAGFSPGLNLARNYQGAGLLTEKAGKYSAYSPLYLSEDRTQFNPAEALKAWFTMEPSSTGLTPESMATTGQRFVYDRSNELLDLSDRLAQATPYEAPKIRQVAGEFLDTVNKALKERKDALAGASAEFVGQVKKARHEYHAAIRAKQFAVASSILFNIGTLGTAQALGPSWSKAGGKGLQVVTPIGKK